MANNWFSYVVFIHYYLLTFKDSKYRRNPNNPKYNKNAPKPYRTVTDSIRGREIGSLRQKVMDIKQITYVYVY